jgi:uncharacterized pyridoxal phosphate-containing UPF0001 family protein
MNKKVSSIFILALIAFLPAVSVNALAVNATDQTSTIQQKVQTREEKIAELKDLNIAKKCEIIKTNVDRLISNYNSKHENQVQKYKEIAGKISNTLDILKNKGIDVSNLQAKLNELNSKIVEFSNLRTEFQNKLNETKTLSCGDSQGAYKTAVQSARDTLKQMKSKAIEIRDFVKNDIRNEIKNIKR